MQPRKKQKLRNKLFNYITFELVFVAIITILFYLNLTVTSKSVIFVPKGSTTNAIRYLNDKHHNLNFIDLAIVKILGYPQGGWINLETTTMTKADFLYKLTTSKAPLKNITLIPGETYYFFLKDVAQKLHISQKQLFKFYDIYAYKKDGNILAQTYSLPVGMDEEELILYLINYTNKQYKKYSNKIFGIYNPKSWFRYIIIASIIQKESASKKEMATISSVIHNRIKRNMKLQMDGTLNYGKFSHTKITPKRIRQDKSRYNTYKYKGIPPNPISAVEFSSIKAAIFPRKTKFLYFVKAKDGKRHIFTKSYTQHKKMIRKLKRVTK